jgi:ergothioneine biosynthesis protein EgtB
MNAPANPTTNTRATLREAYTRVRAHTAMLASTLGPEDQTVQSMPDTSPTRWHQAHTTWFFEVLVLVPHVPEYRALDQRYFELFNSYYESLGPRHPRPQRGVLSRPTQQEIEHYRRYVDNAVLRFIGEASPETLAAAADTVLLGLHHEQQHQELLLTDIKHAFSLNPLRPVWRTAQLESHAPPARPLTWQGFEGGLVEVGNGGAAFAFDNERPRHRVWLEPFELATRPVTVADYQAFIADDGYQRPALWLSEGWTLVQTEGWESPLYWFRDYSRSMAGSPWRHTRPSATSAITKPWPTRIGQVHACRRSSNGNTRPVPGRWNIVTNWTPCIRVLCRQAKRGVSRHCSAKSGSGPPRLMPPIPGFARCRAPPRNTTVNSW